MQNVTNRIESASTEIKVLKVVPVPTYIDFDNQVWIEGEGWAYDEGTDGTFVEWMPPRTAGQRWYHRSPDAIHAL